MEELKNPEQATQKPRTITPVQANNKLEEWRDDYLWFLEHENPIELESKGVQNVSGFRFRPVPHANN